MKVHFSLSVREHDDGTFDVRTLCANGKEFTQKARGPIDALAYIAASAAGAGSDVSAWLEERGKKARRS